MVGIILKSYLNILLSIGFAMAAMLFVGSVFIFKLFGSKKVQVMENMVGMHQADMSDHSPVKQKCKQPEDTDIASISGNNLIATRLDLARAYIETNNFSAAKVLLDMVSTDGSHQQKQEAQKLLEQMDDKEFLDRVRRNTK